MTIGSSFKLDDFSAWVDDASIQIKAVNGKDPVDLGTDEVCEIIGGLARLVKEVDGPERVRELIAEMTRDSSR